ncbi:unnamed protein product [Rhodiola kirilowii]
MGMRSEWSVVSIVDPDHYSSRFFANSDSKPIVLNSFPIMNCSGVQMFPIRNGSVQEQMMIVDEVGDEHDDESVKRVDVVDFFSEKRSEQLQSRDDDDDVDVKRESSHGEAASVRPREFDVVNTGLNLVIANGRSKQSTLDDGISVSAQGSDDKRRTKIELSQLQMELGRMTDENLRLKEMLTAVTSDYKALEFRIMSLMKQKETGHEHKIQNGDVVKPVEKRHGVNGLVEGRNFLGIGRGGSSAAERDEVLSPSLSDEITRSGSAQASGKRPRVDNGELQSKERIELDDHTKGEKRPTVGGEASSDPDPQFGTAAKPGTAKAGIDQQSAEATMRKARVSVRARSDAAMISDGCQWRKYGQKMAKGNPCPRAYYRCTMAVGCPVRKQIQRCAEDRTILVTTYEGNHNHPLPPAAIPMASATTTAATMLLSGSMSSADGLMNPNFLARTMLPYSSSMATISASAPFPTVTLDLTHTPQQHPQAQFSGPIPPQTLASLPFITNQILSQGLHNQSKFSGLQVSQDPSLTDSMAAAITANPNLNAIITAAINNILTSGVNNSNNNNSSSTTSTQRQ